MTIEELKALARTYKSPEAFDKAYLAAVKRLQTCEYPDNPPEFLDPLVAAQRMADLWLVFNHDHPSVD